MTSTIITLKTEVNIKYGSVKPALRNNQGAFAAIWTISISGGNYGNILVIRKCVKLYN